MQGQTVTGNVELLDLPPANFGDAQLPAFMGKGAIGRLGAVEEQPFGDRACPVEDRDIVLVVDRAIETAIAPEGHAIGSREVRIGMWLQHIAEDDPLRCLLPKYVIAVDLARER